MRIDLTFPCRNGGRERFLSPSFVKKGIVMSFSHLSREQLKALLEMSKSGMDHAATALSQLTSKNFRLKVPKVLDMDMVEIHKFLGGTQLTAIGIYLKVLGDARGHIIIFFTRENVTRMLDILLSPGKCSGTFFTELELSALKEVGNILACSYLNALGNRLGMTLIPSVPALSFGMTETMADFVLAKQGEASDLSFIIETKFYEDGDNFSGHFFLLPDHESLEVILRKIAPNKET